MNKIDRRSFLRTSVIAGAAASFVGPFDIFNPTLVQPPSSLSSVAITTGDSRADLAFRALQPYSKQIQQAIGNKRVVLKPNNVSTEVLLCATHTETMEGILEFLKSIKKLDNVIIAESAANAPTFEGFSNYGYFSLEKKYPVKFVDLDSEGSELLYVFDQKDFRPHAVRFSSIILSPDSYVISCARMKTHNLAVATLSLKNIVFGAPVKDIGFRLDKNTKLGTRSDKPTVHGSGPRGINFNLYSLASRVHPHLAVIDGFEGMEGNGPRLGTPVDHRVCVASTDWFAADRVAVELMGIDFGLVGYLNYCAQTGLGEPDLNKIEIVGERISDHIKKYKLHENIEQQLIWMKPVV
ncbi:MAG TPA: DUF362 domain-containing protein [Bacteroidales bacterium]|nr:DUF362 domain-containing protein [Bacteroidales bacterium]